MARYVAMGQPARPRAEWDDQEPIYAGTQVYEQDSEPVNTGLLDARGVPLYRVPTKIPFGFVKG